MYAVIKTGGKQYRVAADDVLDVEKLEGEPGGLVTFEEVLMLGGEGEPLLGTPNVAGAAVTAEVLEQGRGPKLIVFKKRRRKNSRRKNGHRQDLTKVRILEVLGVGQTATRQPSDDGKRRAARKKLQGSVFKPLDAPEGGKADDLSLIDGVGPKLREMLNATGVFHFWQIARMSKQAVRIMERRHDFGGRFEREEWVAQARELALGKPPRAKTDRERAENTDEGAAD